MSDESAVAVRPEVRDLGSFKKGTDPLMARVHGGAFQSVHADYDRQGWPSGDPVPGQYDDAVAVCFHRKLMGHEAVRAALAEMEITPYGNDALVDFGIQYPQKGEINPLIQVGDVGRDGCVSMLHHLATGDKSTTKYCLNHHYMEGPFGEKVWFFGRRKSADA